MSILKRVPLLTAALTTLVLGGCGDDDPSGPSGAGSFTATVSGDLTATLSGLAFSGVFTEDQQTAFVMELGTTDQRYFISFGRDGNRPGTGTVDIGEDAGDFAVAFIYDPTPNAGNEDDRVFFGTGGQVQLTASSGGGVTGTFTLTATDLTGDTITVTGSFQTRCVSVPGENVSCT